MMKHLGLRWMLALVAAFCATANLFAGIGTSINRANWSVQASSWCYDFSLIGAPTDIIDNDPTTYWHSNWKKEQGVGQGGSLPEYIEIDLGKVEEIGGFGYVPRPFFNGIIGNGSLLEYKFYVSNTPFNVDQDEKPIITATPIHSGNIKALYGNTAEEIRQALPQMAKGRYILLEFVSSGGSQPDMFGNCAEFFLYNFQEGNDPGTHDPQPEDPNDNGERSPATALVINEIMVANSDLFLDPSKNYGGYVELYNPTDKPIDLGGMYVSRDPNNLRQFHFLDHQGLVPAHGFKNVWFDNYKASPLQVNFKLEYEGGTIYFSDREGNLAVQQAYPAAITRTSYARKTDGGSEWGTTAYHTPEATNATSKEFANQRLEAPSVEAQDNFFSTTLTANVPIPAGYTLRYTTDGSTPTETNGFTSTTGSFNVTETSSYRFRFFRSGYLPSAVTTRTFIKTDREHPLNVVSVVTESGNLYDDEYGCFVRGTAGIPGRGQSTPCNWNMEWERPVNFEYFTADGKRVFNQEVDLEISGGWSRAFNPKSFKLKATKQYEGKSSLDYPFFAEKPHLKNKTILLRNGGNDYTYRMKDATLQKIVTTSGLDIEAQSYLPVMHYINGRYVGLLNLREPNNKNYASANYGYDDTEIDLFEIGPDSCYSQIYGTEEAYNRWFELSANAADAATYESIKEIVDIDQYINYLAVEMFLGAQDWPRNNIKSFRKRDGGKFRFVLFDLDGTLGHTNPFGVFMSQESGLGDYIFSLKQRLPFHNKFVTIFRNMLQNEQFRKQYIDTYCMMAGSVFHPDRSRPIIQAVADRINPVLAYEGVYNNETANILLNAMTHNRASKMLNALQNYPLFELDGVAPQQCLITSNTPEGKILINNLPVPTNRFDGKLFSPIQLSAATPAGYKFVGWESSGATSGNEMVDIFKKGEQWFYHDQGSLDNTDWKTTLSHQDGTAPFGFSNDATVSEQLKTRLDYGTDPSQKRPTYYFVKRFNLDSLPEESSEITLNCLVDDGCVVYINGQRAASYNMPAGEISYNTYSTTYAGTQPDAVSLNLDRNLFQTGSNTIAVEVHNVSATSTDLYWDAALSYTRPGNNSGEVTYLSTDSIFTLPSAGDFTLKAVFAPLAEHEAEKAAAPVRINEVSAANSIFVNEYNKRNDWVELYNTTDQDIDLAGMFLSDNTKNPQKFRIPAATESLNTIIPAKGYKLIWCDRLANNTQLHANFKLSAEGGDVMLTAADQSWNDLFTYTAMTGDVTAGRYPDGSDNVYTMNKPSIGTTNVYTSYLTAIAQKPRIITGIGTAQATIADLELTAYDDEIALFCTQATKAVVRIFDLSGKQLFNTHCHFQGGTASVSVTLPAGCYIVSATDNLGHTASLKYCVR